MPTVSIARDELFESLGETYTQEAFDEICFEFGLELDDVVTEKPSLGSRALTGVDVELEKQVMYKIEVPANRYDLLCVEGLSQALRVFLGKDAQIPDYKLSNVSEQNMIEMKVASSVNSIRPYVVCAVLKDVQMNAKVFTSLIELQDKLHHNICRKRTLVAIGTHDLDNLNSNSSLSYTAESPADISFVPLAQDNQMNGIELMDFYENDAQLKKYLPIIKDSPVYPVIRDSQSNVLSLPPIINGNMSKVTPDTKNIFIECTATDLTKANIVLNILVAMISKYCQTPYEIQPVKVVYENFNNTNTRKEIITPNFDEPVVEADLQFIRNGIGIQELESNDMIGYLRRMQVTSKVNEDQTKLQVNIPIIRPDILHECDVMCDIAIAYGFNKIPEKNLSTYTISKQQPINTLSDLIRREGFAQQGYTEVLTWVTVSNNENFNMLNRENTHNQVVKIGNPKTSEFEQCRLSLLTGLLKTLKSNRKCKIPIRLFEVGDVVEKDSDSETGAKNRRKCAAIYCSNSAGFEVIQGLLEHCLKILGLERYFDTNGKTINDHQWDLDDQNCEDDCFMIGRRANIIYQGKSIGTCGWIHPSVLKNFSLTYPCAAFEFDLQVFV